MSDYSEFTDCPICPQVATDRDDALREVAALQYELDLLHHQLGHIRALCDSDHGRNHVVALISEATDEGWAGGQT